MNFRNLSYIITTLTVFFVLMAPFSVSVVPGDFITSNLVLCEANDTPPNSDGPNVTNPPPNENPNDKKPTSINLQNPLKFGSVEDLFVGILSALMVLMMPIIVFFIIYAGFLYVTARGNPEQIKKATTALTYAVIGGVIVIGALAIAEIIKGIISPFVK